MADRIEADYQALNNIARQFAQRSSRLKTVFRKVSSETTSLARDGWKGRGSAAFFREMQDEVLPGLQRLHEALDEASRVTKQVSDEMAKGEEEASAPFRSM